MSVILLTLLACPKNDEDAIECAAEADCPFGSVCTDGQCVPQTCATSDQCGIEYYCKSSECVPGCEADTDCRFGDFCDTEINECVASKCTDTHLDCEFGQFCSQVGECYDAGNLYCRECEDDGDCGGGGNACIWGECQVECDDQVDCPAGFVCSGVTDYNGNILGNWCITSCP